MKKLLVVYSLLFIVLLSGCEMLLLDAAMDFNLSLEPTQVKVSRGSAREITVKVSRVLPVNVAPVPISLTLYPPPIGVSLEDESVEIPNGIDERVLTIVVDDRATLGNHELTIEGTTGLKIKQAKLILTVE
jgi:uncharacterized protein (DUF58 family)